MKQYFVLYMASSKDFQKVMQQMSAMTPDQQKKANKEWEQWSKDQGDAVVDMGKPLGKTKRVTKNDVRDIKNEIGGYSIIQAGSHDEAARIMQNNPHFGMIPDGWIEVMEVMEM